MKIVQNVRREIKVKIKTRIYAMLPIYLGLVVSNYLFQILVGTHNWQAAFERSFFQFGACVACLLFYKPNE